MIPSPGADRTNPLPPKRKAQPRNQIGQKIGEKGARTRQRLIDATIMLLETVGLRDVTVAQVAKLAGTSPATFYVYFEGVPEVVLAALDIVEQATPELLAILAQDFEGAEGADLARRFVAGYVAQWQTHRTIFRVRNMASEEGDSRFEEARLRHALPIILALEPRIALSQTQSPQSRRAEPRAIAGTLLMMLERLAAVAPLMRDDPRTNEANLVLAAACFLHFALASGDIG